MIANTNEPLLSDMDRGVLRMPADLALADPVASAQFYARVQSLLDRIEARTEAPPIDLALLTLKGALADSAPVGATSEAGGDLDEERCGTPTLESELRFRHECDLHNTAGYRGSLLYRRTLAALSAPPPSTRPAEAASERCKACGGTGVDGDCGDDGRVIDVPCSTCKGRGVLALAAEAPQEAAQPPEWFAYGLACARAVDGANRERDEARAALRAQEAAQGQAGWLAQRLADALRCSIDIGARRTLLPSEVTHWQALLVDARAAQGQALPEPVLAWVKAEGERIAAVHAYNDAHAAAEKHAFGAVDLNPHFQRMTQADNAQRRLLAPMYAALAQTAQPAQPPTSKVPQWQPIETAPRDGTGILALWVHPGDSIGARNYAVVEFARGCWWSVDDLDVPFSEPALWMPLPATPSAEAPATGEQPAQAPTEALRLLNAWAVTTRNGGVQVDQSLACRAYEAIKPFLVLAPTQAAQAPSGAVHLPGLDDDLRAILGRPNFACIWLANDLRAVGFEIAHKSEHEQAAVLHYMLGFYLKHGAGWADACGDDMERRVAARARATPAQPGAAE